MFVYKLWNILCFVPLISFSNNFFDKLYDISINGSFSKTLIMYVLKYELCPGFFSLKGIMWFYHGVYQMQNNPTITILCHGGAF